MSKKGKGQGQGKAKPRPDGGQTAKGKKNRTQRNRQEATQKQHKEPKGLTDKKEVHLLAFSGVVRTLWPLRLTSIQKKKKFFSKEVDRYKETTRHSKGVGKDTQNSQTRASGKKD